MKVQQFKLCTGAPTAKNKIAKQKNQNTKVASAKLEFDTVQSPPFGQGVLGKVFSVEVSGVAVLVRGGQTMVWFGSVGMRFVFCALLSRFGS